MIVARSPGLPRYDDPSLRPDANATAGRDGRRCYQVLPVPESLRSMAAPLMLPAVIDTGFARDADGTWYPFECNADLEPDVNRGCTWAWIHFWDPPGGNSLDIVVRRGGRGQPEYELATCPACGAGWALRRSGVLTCQDCGHKE
jgi:hypothetical protein